MRSAGARDRDLETIQLTSEPNQMVIMTDIFTVLQDVAVGTTKESASQFRQPRESI